jgi:hypothetical protein
MVDKPVRYENGNVLPARLISKFRGCAGRSFPGITKRFNAICVTAQPRNPRGDGCVGKPARNPQRQAWREFCFSKQGVNHYFGVREEMAGRINATA